MFYYASKIAWLFATPSTVLAILIGVGVGLARTGRAKLGRRIAGFGVAGLFACGLGPVGNWLIIPLEDRFAKPADDAPAPFGIIVLGGGVEDRLSSLPGRSLEVNEAADRIITLLELARRYPEAKLVVSGGSGGLSNRAPLPEAEIIRRRIGLLGVAPGRLIVEDGSRTTSENARATAALLRSAPDRGAARTPSDAWWLITSAYHMPRAIGAFRAAGLDVVAYPVDYRTAGSEDAMRPFGTLSEGLRRTDLAAKEWLGLVGYFLSGRTQALFPGP